MQLLEARDLKKYYATQKAVDDISFTIQPGTIFWIARSKWSWKNNFAPNDHRYFYPDEGEILLEGKTFDPMKDIEKIGYMPEERGLYKKMKIGEQALYLAQLKGLERSKPWS